MTANEQAESLLLELNRVGSGASFSYTDEELSGFLTKAQWHYIKMFSGLMNSSRASIEETERRGQGLSNLIRQSEPLVESSDTSFYPNAYIYLLPKDFMWTAAERILITHPDCESTIDADVRVVESDEHAALICNTYKKPRILDRKNARVWRKYYNYGPGTTVTDIGDSDKDTSSVTTTPIFQKHEIVIPEGATIVEYRMVYWKLPDNIVVDNVDSSNQVDCELDDSTHETIVEIARDKILGAVKEQKVMNQIDVEDLE